MLNQTSAVIRFVAFVTLVTFFPSSIAIWNIIPERWVVVEAAEPLPTETAANSRDANSAPKALSLLADEELKAATGGPGELAKLSKESSQEAERRMRVASAGLSLPTSEVLLASIPKPGTKKQVAKPEPIKLAQLDSFGREVRGPLGPQEAVDDLSAADALKNSGAISDALIAYFEIMDEYPSTNEALWADQGMWDVMEGIVAGTVSRNSVAAFESWLPTWEPVRAEGYYAVLTYYAERALDEKEANQENLAASYAILAKSASWSMIANQPTHYLSMSAGHYYWEMSRLLGLEVEATAMAELHELASTMESSPGRMGAWFALGVYYADPQTNARGDAIIAWANLVGQSTKPFVEEILDDEAIPYWVKGKIGESVGQGLAYQGRFAEAKEWFDRGISLCEHVGPAHWFLAYESARMTEFMNQMNPSAGVEAFQDYIEAYPDSQYVDRALVEIGALYMLASDYQGAADIFSEVTQRNPESKAAVLAEHELAYIMEHLYDAMPAIAKNAKPLTEEEIKVAQVCGPNALRALLESHGIDATVDELANLAGTDDTGTTMLGLVEAARAKGVAMVGVRANNVKELALPAIIYVNQNHFMLLEEVLDDAVEVFDGPNGEQPFTAAEFSAMWNGEALVTGQSGGDSLTVATLEANKGGDSTSQSPNMYAVPMSEYQGYTGGAGNAAVDPSSLAKGPERWAAVNSTGVNMMLNAYESCIDIREKDIVLCSRGPLALSFGRVYINEKGYSRSVAAGQMGTGWASNLAIRARLSELEDDQDEGSAPYMISFQDSSGTSRQYDHDGDDGTYYLFKRASTGQTDEDGIKVRYKMTGPGGSGSTRKVYIDFPNGLQYEFNTAGTSPGGAGCRLNLIKDANSGNTITFVYTSTSNSALLTKVQGPLGDARHIFLSHDTNNSLGKITKAELKENSNVLQTVTYEYESSKLTKVTDNDTKTIKYFYQSQGSGSQVITKVTDKGNRDTNLAWYFADDSNGKWGAYKIEVTNTAGMKDVYDRSLSSSIDTITPKNGGGTNLGKSVMTPVTGDASRTRYEDGYSDASTYDRYGYEYNANADLTKTVRPDNNPDGTFSYTTVGRISTVADTDGTTIGEFDYASATALQPSKITNATGLVTNYAYDASNRMTMVTPPKLGANGVTMAFDAYGQVTSSTNPAGQSMTLAYDDCGNVTSSKDPLNNETKFEYDNYGNVTRQIDPRNKSTYLYYASIGCGGCGGAGLLTKVTDALNNETVFAYDVNGNKTKITDALGRATDYFYDTSNRLTKVESPSGSGVLMTTEFDLLGQITKTTDFNGKADNYFYNWFGELTKQSDGVGTYVEYAYKWWVGSLSKVTDGGGNVTDYDYDPDGHLTKVNYADGKATKYFHDSNGRQTKVGAGSSGSVDPTEWFYHGVTGHMTKVRYTSGIDTADTFYGYNSNGQLTKLTDWIDAVDGLRYAYDNAGRLTKLTDYDDSTLDYTYDAAGNILTMDDYHGSVVAYTYTDCNEVSTITAPGSKVWDYDHNAIGQPTQYSHPNGMTTAYAYDSRNRMTKIEHKDGGTVLDGFIYEKDKHSNITKTTNQDSSYWDYWYDLRDRLTKAERKNSGGTLLKRWTYTYSLADNMTTKQTYDGTTTETYSYFFTPGNELTTQTLSGTDTTFGYDDWGRMTLKASGGSSASYHWNYGGKLTKVASNFAGEGTVEYEYGGDAKRRERVSGGVTTWYNYDRAWGLINEEDGSNGLSKTYIHDPAKPIGTVLADLATATPASGTARYYYQDNIGSTRRLRDASKGNLGQYEYEPYGSDYVITGSTINHKFIGHEWDETSELYFAPYRCYSPSRASWISRDPLGMADGPNLYAYVNGQPTKFYDELGLCGPCVLALPALMGAIAFMGSSLALLIYFNRIRDDLQNAINDAADGIMESSRNIFETFSKKARSISGGLASQLLVIYEDTSAYIKTTSTAMVQRLDRVWGRWKYSSRPEHHPSPRNDPKDDKKTIPYEHMDEDRSGELRPDGSIRHLKGDPPPKRLEKIMQKILDNV